MTIKNLRLEQLKTLTAVENASVQGGIACGSDTMPKGGGRGSDGAGGGL